MLFSSTQILTDLLVGDDLRQFLGAGQSAATATCSWAEHRGQISHDMLPKDLSSFSGLGQADRGAAKSGSGDTRP